MLTALVWIPPFGNAEPRVIQGYDFPVCVDRGFGAERPAFLEVLSELLISRLG